MRGKGRREIRLRSATRLSPGAPVEYGKGFNVEPANADVVLCLDAALGSPFRDR
jgi:hypothetical protein